MPPRMILKVHGLKALKYIDFGVQSLEKQSFEPRKIANDTDANRSR
jgi:hypothetical protein